MERTNLTKLQLENLISEKIQNLYLEHLKQQLQKISYRWQSNRLTLVMEGTVTQPEQLLYQCDRRTLAYRVRNTIDLVILPKIKQEIEKIAEVNITDFLCDTKIETGRTGVIIIFQLKPDYSPEQFR